MELFFNVAPEEHSVPEVLVRVIDGGSFNEDVILNNVLIEHSLEKFFIEAMSIAVFVLSIMLSNLGNAIAAIMPNLQWLQLFQLP